MQVIFQLFQELQGVNGPARVEYLRKVADGEASASKVIQQIKEQKKLQIIKQKFLEITDTDSWEEAVENFPGYTDLSMFLGEKSVLHGIGDLFISV